MDVLCTDKTGTLTEARIRLERHVDAGGCVLMAGAAVFLPFLPMLPVQILLNNMLYDVSEVPIPMDQVDEAEVARPRAWDMRFVRDFMWTMGPVSSLFDFATFALLLAWLRANEALFQTGWFIESMATQVLVIFVIVRALLAGLGLRTDLHLLRKDVADELIARLREHAEWEDRTLYPWAQRRASE